MVWLFQKSSVYWMEKKPLAASDRFSNQEAFCDSLNPGYLNDYVSHTFSSLDLRKSPQFGEMTAHRDMDM